MDEIFKNQFNSLKEITGLPFKRYGSRMICATYINGSKHSQKDKTYAVLKDNGVYIKEQGGDDLSLPEWLKMYGNESNLNNFDLSIDHVDVKKPERIFVDPIHFESTISSQYSGNLFLFLSSLFGFEKVTNVFHRYNVGESGQSDVIYWYMNESNQVCHDSIVPYGTNGKRLKERGGYRRFRVDMGYSGICLFGSHLIPKWQGEVSVVESEKAALIMALVDSSRLWIATGGSAKFNGIKPDFKLYPDFDNAGSFWECFGCDNRNSKDCIISVVDGKRLKGWGCTLANKNVKHWWEGLEVKEGWGSDDFILNNLKI